MNTFKSAKSSISKMPSRKPFQFMTVIRPERDIIGAYFHEAGRAQFCIGKDVLAAIEREAGSVKHGPWQIGQSVHRRLEPRDVHRVVSTHFGWRVQRRIPADGCMRTLGHVLVDIPVLFPTTDDAITTSEIMMMSDPPSEFCIFTWLPPWCQPPASG
jgi:hypothetical protein